MDTASQEGREGKLRPSWLTMLGLPSQIVTGGVRWEWR